jgi:mRNA interferase MazF
MLVRLVKWGNSKGHGQKGYRLFLQLVKIDYNIRKASYVETVIESLLDELLEKVKLLFQKDS